MLKKGPVVSTLRRGNLSHFRPNMFKSFHSHDTTSQAVNSNLVCVIFHRGLRTATLTENFLFFQACEVQSAPAHLVRVTKFILTTCLFRGCRHCNLRGLPVALAKPGLANPEAVALT